MDQMDRPVAGPLMDTELHFESDPSEGEAGLTISQGFSTYSRFSSQRIFKEKELRQGMTAEAHGSDNWQQVPLSASGHSSSPYSPVLHAAVAPDGLLHVGMALRSRTGPGPLPGLSLRRVVAIAPLSTTTTTTTSSSATTTSSSITAPSSSTASSRRWSGAKATETVLTATLEVVLSAGERHLHPDPGFWGLLF
ncbi:hypothetical protein FQN60_000857 [Etheostoma spectabile]|uniref:Uncharacterized protein n=1 Tax=Etheostoma spectabile TaxID=54343 RepID=A0A5J5D654_9PERO|nr:hypothetical protein FQN60_000857 [Etheostoma spectabile]